MATKGFGKKHILIFAVILAAIMLYAVFGERGFIDVYRVKAERDSLAARNLSLTAQNEKLSREIELLKSDGRYIASVARKELGMVGTNEVIYRIERNPPRQ